MSDPTGMGGLLDVEAALQREVDVLTQRFPEVDRDDLEHNVRETYDELEAHAEVKSHLLAVTRARVTEKLRERGEHIHVRSDNVE